MANFIKFEEIIAWQYSKKMAAKVYFTFSKNSDFSFKDQICRASVSVMNNIAEGYERQSDQEFIHFLRIANASAAEVRSMLYLAKELKYVSDESFLELFNINVDTTKMLKGLIKSLHN